jgi:hypothetical protein
MIVSPGELLAWILHNKDESRTRKSQPPGNVQSGGLLAVSGIRQTGPVKISATKQIFGQVGIP